MLTSPTEISAANVENGTDGDDIGNVEDNDISIGFSDTADSPAIPTRAAASTVIVAGAKGGRTELAG